MKIHQITKILLNSIYVLLFLISISSYSTKEIRKNITNTNKTIKSIKPTNNNTTTNNFNNNTFIKTSNSTLNDSTIETTNKTK